MPGPVIVDDGGSMRIRRIEGDFVGHMDELLDVDSVTRKSDHSKIRENFSQVLIVWQDKDGVPGSMPFPFNGTVEVACHFDQRVQFEKIGDELQISVVGKPMEPMVLAKRQKEKQSYTFTNSGAIEKVYVDGALEYDTVSGKAGNGATSVQIPKPIVFTSVVLS